MVDLKIGNKVKTVLNLKACPIICQIKNEDYYTYPAYYKLWKVKSINPIILVDNKGLESEIDNNGFLLSKKYIGHCIYKIK